MKPMFDLEMVGLNTLWRRLVLGMGCAAASMAAPAAAVAQIQTYYRAGAWDAFSGRNSTGGAVCGIGNTSSVDNRRLSIRRDIGGTDTVFSVSKPGWSIPDNTRVSIVMQIGLNTPWTEQGIGHGQTIDWPLDRGLSQPFNDQFRGASSMTLVFPNGNEAPWTIMLAGSSAVSDAFGRCVSDLTRQVEAEQGAGSRGPAGATGPAAAPTQPFAQPDSAPSGVVQNPTQPVETQPGGIAPDQTQQVR